MLTMSVSHASLRAGKSASILFFVNEGFLNQKSAQSSELKELFKQNPHIPATLEQQKFFGKAASLASVVGLFDGRPAFFIFAGLGADTVKIPVERYRRAVGSAVRAAQKAHMPTLAFELPAAGQFDLSLKELAQETATMLALANYHFDEFITDPERRSPDCFDVSIHVAAKNESLVEQAIEVGEIIGKAVNKARHWVDLPPADLTPVGLADKAEEIARQHGLDFVRFDEKQVNLMGMGGLAAVSRGSEIDCQLIAMTYKPQKKNPKKIVIVGKGITFDSGGLSLKPAQYMETMKDDMSGASAVIATMQAIAQLKPDVQVIAVAPLAENLPGSGAVKPGDIIRFYNGKTAEIKNTDAEGRLVLADALAYAVKQYEPDFMIDLATLTGSCAHALGPFFSGLMSQHDVFVEKIQLSAARSGDRVWRLPLDDDYKPAIRSEVADICNIGSSKYMAGVITAAFFLKNFVEDVPWAHLDIAGTSFDVPDIPYYRPGATGAGVRLLVDLIMHWE